MDACVRCLRDGRVDTAASVVLIVDDADVQGGSAVFDQVVKDLAAAVSEGRSQAQRVHAVAIDMPPSELQAAGVHSVSDLFTDPAGWLSCSSGVLEQVQWQDLKALQQLAQADAAAWSTAAGVGNNGSCCLVVAGLSTLLMRHPVMQVIQVLLALKSCSHVSSMLLSVHQDLHTPQVMSALQTLSSMVLQLHPLQGLQQELITKATGHSCHGQITASSKRARVGRLKVEQQLYSLLPDGGVQVFAAPEGAAVDAKLLVESSLVQQQQQQWQQKQQQRQQQAGDAVQAAPAAGGAVAAAAGAAAAAAGDELAQKISSSMRLEVSEQERAARAAVQLPYVHQGASKTYTAEDARQYLPPAAGGFGPGVDDGAGSGRLGHILYVRDSEEEHDSDEDPDDDLDI
ncbi:hypothetical protein OEZ85_012992 [Tetradesmus obliquus]|uniref:Elongator complex protein 5 n=1 Tax=Tetradesmus obliquus TaxID=3088 RepID=A0ABY8U4I7_TETOB|nr:hypothetical protein OEZ85_012992 [Tetradesmus obliquus]